jgi:hypothetical protein
MHNARLDPEDDHLRTHVHRSMSLSLEAGGAGGSTMRLLNQTPQ